MTREKEINIKPGMINGLKRTYSLILKGLEEIKDPLSVDNSTLENFLEGVNYQKDKITEAKIKHSINLENDSWKYNGTNAYFKKQDNAHVVLVMPEDSNPKYIHGMSKSGKEIVVALPESFHKFIKSKYEELTEEKIYSFSISGGRIKKEDKKFILYGESVDFGRANHEEVSGLLKKLGFPAEAKK